MLTVLAHDCVMTLCPLASPGFPKCPAPALFFNTEKQISVSSNDFKDRSAQHCHISDEKK